MTAIETRPTPEKILGIFHLRIKENCVDRFMAAVEDVLIGSATEEGLIRFEYLQSRTDRTLFTFVDFFRDEAAFQAHQTTSHQRRFHEAIAEFLDGPVEGGLHFVRAIFDRAGGRA